MCHDLEEVLTCFRGISHDIWNVPVSCSVGKLEIQINPQDCDYSNESASADDDDDDDETKDDETEESQDTCTSLQETTSTSVAWNDRLTGFQKLCLIKAFKEEKVCYNYF